ncbi:MAG TPA: hypothetical protein PK530_11500 [Anaerolineales bacterium]|nr:hypothetical protein [Anaerolineales bacterium]
MPKPRLIGTLSEKSLHAALKAYLTQPGDLIETSLDGYVIDILRGEQIIEVQTGNFSAMKRKLGKLLGAGHPVRVMYPLPVGKWIVRQTGSGELIGRRKSPTQRRPVEVFRQLVYIPHILPHPNFTLEILLTHQEEIWRDDGLGSWRRKGWSLYDHRLLDVVGQVTLTSAEDFLALLPENLPTPFTNRQLATILKITPGLAGKMTYTLRGAGWLAEAGKKGKAILFSPVNPHSSISLDAHPALE